MLVVLRPPHNLHAMVGVVHHLCGVLRWDYSLRISEGTMDEQDASYRVDTMESVLQLLETIRDASKAAGSEGEREETHTQSGSYRHHQPGGLSA